VLAEAAGRGQFPQKILAIYGEISGCSYQFDNIVSLSMPSSTSDKPCHL
jgi:hypothetical protein